MRYTGRFRNIHNEVIEVNIITNNDESQETELTFVGDSPVTITQESDGIFSPIKSRGCTITIICKKPYYDIYSGSSHGTKVTVNNISKAECLFFGYVTPCEYNQPYVYLDEVSIECVDALSSLQDFVAKDREVITVKNFLIKAFDLAGYKGHLFMPFLSLKSKADKEAKSLATEGEAFIQSIFVDDDDIDNSDSYYTVLEEIGRFYNVSFVPHGDDVYVIDYNSIINNGSYATAYNKDNKELWYDLKEGQDTLISYFGYRGVAPNQIIEEKRNNEIVDKAADMQGADVDVPIFHLHGTHLHIEGSDDSIADIYVNKGQQSFNLKDDITYIITDVNHVELQIKSIGNNTIQPLVTPITNDINNRINLANIDEYWFDLPKLIVKNDYAGEDQNVELDEVYNKVVVEADVNEIEDDDFEIDPEKQEGKKTYWLYTNKDMPLPEQYDSNSFNTIILLQSLKKNYPQLSNYSNEELLTILNGSYKSFTRMFKLTKDNNKFWKSYFKANVTDSSNPSLTSSMTYVTENSDEAGISTYNACLKDSNNYYYQKYRYAKGMNCQCYTPAQYFNYSTKENKPKEITWENYHIFHTGIYWLKQYFDNNPTVKDERFIPVKAGEPNDYHKITDPDAQGWINWYKEAVIGDTPMLIYSTEKEITCSPVDDRTNYFIFSGDLCYQKNGNFGERRQDVWGDDVNISESVNYLTVPLIELGFSGDEEGKQIDYREATDSDYNKGWDCLKCRLSVGNKYWNGTSWVNYIADFWIPYHLKDAEDGKRETIVYYEWLKPVSHNDYEDKINSDGFSIPIKKSDGLVGKVKFEIFQPLVQPNWQFVARRSVDNYSNIEKDANGNMYMVLGIGNLEPCVFMKNLKLKMVSTDDSTEWYNIFDDDETEDDDIKYSNSVESNNVIKGDELSLKINTYNEKKPLATSYIMDVLEDNSFSLHTDGFFDYKTQLFQREELFIINRYTEHYKQPKVKYNCNVHGYYMPYKLVTTTALPDRKFIVDAQEYDVKADINNLNLIEY